MTTLRLAAYAACLADNQVLFARFAPPGGSQDH